MINSLEKNKSNQIINNLQTVVLFFVFLPVFFLLTGEIFTSKEMIYDSGGQLLRVPLPLSIIFCFIGIVLLLRLENRQFGMWFVFSAFMLMMLSTVISTGDTGKAELSKFLLLIQYILPMFGLVLGKLYVEPIADYLKLEAIILYVLLLVIPTEVFVTIYNAIAGYNVSLILSPNLYFFSIYQHLQYLPVIFTGLYLLLLVKFCDKSKLRYGVLFLAPWLGMYLAASSAILAIALALLGGMFAAYLLIKKNKKLYISSIFSLVFISFCLYFSCLSSDNYNQKFNFIEKVDVKEPNKNDKFTKNIEPEEWSYLPQNLRKRIFHWKFYINEIVQNPKVFLFGQQQRADRKVHPSAHNFYLAIIYNFGIISVFPFIYLIFITAKQSVKYFKSAASIPSLAMLIFLISYFILVDNFLKVSLQQPYSGIIMYFLWGKLLSELSSYSSTSEFEMSRGDKK